MANITLCLITCCDPSYLSRQPHCVTQLLDVRQLHLLRKPYLVRHPLFLRQLLCVRQPHFVRLPIPGQHLHLIRFHKMRQPHYLRQLDVMRHPHLVSLILCGNLNQSGKLIQSGSLILLTQLQQVRHSGSFILLALSFEATSSNEAVSLFCSVQTYKTLRQHHLVRQPYSQDSLIL